MPRRNNTVIQDRDRDAERKAATIRLLNRPEDWSHLVLPVFKRTADGKELAVIVPPIICPTWRVYPKVNIWALDALDWNTAPYTEYQTIDAILADGWLVD